MDTRKNTLLNSFILSVAIAGITANHNAASETTSEENTVQRGQYLAKVSGCNDCHTSGYLMSNGDVPVDQWLTGDSFGWRGPWGTTYPPNLRLFVSNMTEDEWVATAKTLKRRPPMPWFNLNAMSEPDLRALYQFIRSLGEPGQPAPAYLPPGKAPKTPYALFPSPPQEALPLVEHGTSTYYTLATIEGTAECPFMVDTGAGYTTISEAMLKDLQKHDLVKFKRSITAVMADGSESIVKIYLVKKITLGSNCSFLDVEVAVLPGNSRAILGMNLLKRATFTINPKSASLSVECEETGNPVLLGPDI